MVVDPPTPVVEIVRTALIGDRSKCSDCDLVVLGNVDETNLTYQSLLHELGVLFAVDFLEFDVKAVYPDSGFYDGKCLTLLQRTISRTSSR